MPSDKRARQRAAREIKQAEIQKVTKRRRNMRRGLSLVVLAAAVILIVVLIGNNKKTPTAAGGSTTTSTTATTTTTTTPVPTTQPLTTAAVAPTCPTKSETKRIVWFTKAPSSCITKTSIWDATFDTSVGDFVVKMQASKSFAAVNNFIFLARWNYYNGTFFHRIIPGFVIQGGDPTGLGTGGPHAFPGYSFTGNYPPESCTKTVTAACYQIGDFVMANSNSNSKTQNASTDGSQFFVVLPGGQTQLNSEPTYTLFGKVISGLTVVEKIGTYGTSAGTPTAKVYVTSVKVKQTNG